MATTKKSAKKSGKKAAAKGGTSVLAQAKAALNKALKKDDWNVDLDINALTTSLPHHPSGSLIIDHLIGGKPNQKGVAPCPGIPKAKILNLYGHESSGKTTLALTAAAAVASRGGSCCYIDWENEIVPSYAAALGVPIGDDDRFLLCQPETLEEGCSILWTMATAGVDLIIADSVGAGVPKAIFEKKINEVADLGRLGANAAIWSNFLPKVKSRINRTGSSVIGISQLRDAVNVMGYGEKFTVQGGRAWRFFSAIRMHLKAVGKEKTSAYSSVTNKSEDRVVGVKVRARLEKCKVSAQQGNEEFFYIRWGQGIDDLRSIMEIAQAHNVIAKGGSWFQWVDPSGEQHRKQGLDTLRTLFEKEPKLRKALEQQVLPYMAAMGDGPVDEEEVDLEDALGTGSEDVSETSVLDEGFVTELDSVIADISHQE